jgi:hypothetical protein
MFKSPLYMAFLATEARTDCSFRLTPPSPLLCQALHGNKVTNAHHEKGGVSADGHASAPPLPGRRGCAAGGR